MIASRFLGCAFTRSTTHCAPANANNDLASSIYFSLRTIEGDGISGRRRAVGCIARGLQHPIPGIVVKEAIAGRGATRGYLASHAPDGVVYLSEGN